MDNLLANFRDAMGKITGSTEVRERAQFLDKIAYLLKEKLYLHKALLQTVQWDDTFLANFQFTQKVLDYLERAYCFTDQMLRGEKSMDSTAATLRGFTQLLVEENNSVVNYVNSCIWNLKDIFNVETLIDKYVMLHCRRQ
jgi:hypothetical protein